MVVGGGALGGLVSVAEAWTDPLAYPLTFAKFATLAVIPFVKGGLAGGIGVYLLTSFDATQVMRTFFFAVTCGLAFPQILTKGQGMAEHATAQVARQVIDDSADRIKEIAAAHGVGDANAVVELKDAATNALDAQRSVLTSEGKASAMSAVQDALAALKDRVASGDPAAAGAIADIATSASTRGFDRPSQTGLRDLTALRDSPALHSEVQNSVAANIGRLQALADSGGAPTF